MDCINGSNRENIFCADRRGIVGSGSELKLRKVGYNNIVTRTSVEFELRNHQAVNDFLDKRKNRYI